MAIFVKQLDTHFKLMKSNNLIRILFTALLFAVVTAGAKAYTLPPPSAHVFVVYSGKESVDTFTSTQTTIYPVASVPVFVYVVIDLANPSSFSTLTVNKDQTYTIHTRVLSANGSSVTAYYNGTSDTSSVGTDPQLNLFAGITNTPRTVGGNPTAGYAIFRYAGIDGTSPQTFGGNTYNYPNEFQSSLTGNEVGLSTTVANSIISANARARVSGVYTINANPTALTNYIGTVGNAATIPYPNSVTGPVQAVYQQNYLSSLAANPVAGVPTLFSVSVGGTGTLSLNTTLTSLANVGGSYKFVGSNPVTINPVAHQLNSSSSPTVYEDFLYLVAQSLKLTGGYVPTP